MTKFKLSLATALAIGMGSTAFGADDVASAFKDGKFDGRVRMQYFYTNWDDNEAWANTYDTAGTKTNGTPGAKSSADSRGLAIGGSLIYKTAPLYGVSLGVGAYTTQSPHTNDDGSNSTSSKTGYDSYKNTTASDLFARGPGAATDFGSGYSVLGQAYVQYDIGKSDIKIGRMLMTNPFINPNDSKMIPVAVEGISARVAELGNNTLTLDYANRIKERGMTYFGNMADTGDTPDAIKNYYNTHYTGTSKSPVTAASTYVNTNGATVAVSTASSVGVYGSGGDAPAVMMAGIKNRSFKDLELQGWVMNWPAIVRQYMAEANYNIKLGSTGIGFGARYMAQQDTGAGDIIRPGSGDSVYSLMSPTNGTPAGSKATEVALKGDNNNKVDTHMLAVRTIVSYEKAKLLLAYARTDKGGDMIAPWRGFPTDGYTRSMTQTDWNANTKSYKAQIDYDLSRLVTGASVQLSYSYYDRDPTKVPYQSMTDRYYNNGDTKQWNLDVKYAVPYVKGLEWKIRTMIQKNSIVPDNLLPNGALVASASEGFGNNTSNREIRIEMNYLF